MHISYEVEINKTMDDETMTEEMDVPDAFVCPISLQIMSNPVTDINSGHTFERKTIEEWLIRSKGSGTNPLTRGPLRLSDLVPNTELRTKIMKWKVKSGYQDIKQAEDAAKIKKDPIPWYRQKPTDPTAETLPATTSISLGPIVGNNTFMVQLLEAQRKDAEFHRMLSMVRRFPYNNNRGHH